MGAKAAAVEDQSSQLLSRPPTPPSRARAFRIGNRLSANEQAILFPRSIGTCVQLAATPAQWEYDLLRSGSNLGFILSGICPVGTPPNTPPTPPRFIDGKGLRRVKIPGSQKTKDLFPQVSPVCTENSANRSAPILLFLPDAGCQALLAAWVPPVPRTWGSGKARTSWRASAARPTAGGRVPPVPRTWGPGIARTSWRASAARPTAGGRW